MKVARSWWKWWKSEQKQEVTDPDLFERMLKLERELHSAVLELADLNDFVHRMAKRRYTENYDAVVPREPRTPGKPPGAPRAGVAGMTPAQKRDFLSALRKA